MAYPLQLARLASTFFLACAGLHLAACTTDVGKDLYSGQQPDTDTDDPVVVSTDDDDDTDGGTDVPLPASDDTDPDPTVTTDEPDPPDPDPSPVTDEMEPVSDEDVPGTDEPGTATDESATDDPAPIPDGGPPLPSDDGGAPGPRVVLTIPALGEIGVEPDGNVVVRFDRVVSGGDGTVSLVQTLSGSVVESVEVSDPRILFDDAEVTIDFGTLLARSTRYSVVIDDGAIVDDHDGAFGAWTTPDVFFFTTKAADPLTLVSTNPVSGAVDVDPSSDVTLTFSEAVMPGAEGNLVITDRSTLQPVLELPVADSARVFFDYETVTFDLYDELEYATQYIVTLDADAIVSTQGAAFEGISGSLLEFQTIAPPALVLSSTVPADNAVDVDPGVTLVLTFSEAVVPGAGSLEVRRSSNDALVETVAIDSAAVAIANNTVTVDLTATLDNATGYYVTVSPGFVVSNLGADFAGVTTSTAFSFTTAASPPAPLLLFSTVPSDAATDVSVDTNITLSFDQDIRFGAGNISIFQSADDTLFETIPVQDTRVSLGVTTATINPSGTLEGNTGYYVLVTAGCFESTAGASFAGISAKTDFSFTTENRFGLVALSPLDDATGVNPATNLELTFSENVQAGSGSVDIYTQAGGSLIESIPTSDTTRVSYAGTRVTIDLDSLLGSNTGYYVSVSDGALEQSGGNASFSGISGTTAWTFSTSSVTFPGSVSTGLVLWLDADHAPSVKQSSGVRLWADRSGQRNNVSQGTSAARPTRTTGAINSRAVISFDGENDALVAALGFELSAFEGFVVWRSPSSASTTGQKPILVNGDNFELNHGFDSANRASIRSCTGADCSNANSWYAAQFTPLPAANGIYLWDFGFDGITSSLFARSQGSTAVVQAGPTSAPNDPATPFSVGAGPGHCGTCAFGGDIAEIVLYSRKLTQPQREAVVAYLRQKWSVAAPSCSNGETLGPNGSCYFYATNTVTWSTARSNCQSRGAGWDLVTIRSQAEHDYVTDLLSGQAWIGATDTGTPNSWRWVTDNLEFWSGLSASQGGTASNGAFSLWRSTDPSGGATEECARYSAELNFADNGCNDSFGYVCEGPGD